MRRSKLFLLLIICFLISRVILFFIGFRLDTTSLYTYWQYLDVYTLQHNLWRGVFFDHTQPPLFNLILGGFLKIFPAPAYLAFEFFFKAVSLGSILVLAAVVWEVSSSRWIRIGIPVFYMLSPATILFENELFYTGLISFFLLWWAWGVLRISRQHGWGSALFVVVPILAVAFTRSMYHIVWVLVICLLIFCYLPKKARKPFAVIASAGCLLLLGWYVKNDYYFDSFSTSSWMGMNISRNVFLQNSPRDTSNIAHIEPFSPITSYREFIDTSLYSKYRGLNDRDLFEIHKNDSFQNVKHVGYLQVSEQYLRASKKEMKENPGRYLVNAAQSAITFFAPVSRYPPLEKETAKFRLYDMVYSFNLSPLAHGLMQRRVALGLSALPKLLLYLFVLGYFIRTVWIKKRLDLLPACLILTMLFNFGVSSAFEHFENMRFRYEQEPLYLVLLAIVIQDVYNRLQKRRNFHSASAIQ